MDDPERTIRLLVKTGRGYQMVMPLVAKRMDDCEDWLHEARDYSPYVEFKFEETSGKLIKHVRFAETEPAAFEPPIPAEPPVEPKKPPSVIAGLWDLLRGGR